MKRCKNPAGFQADINDPSPFSIHAGLVIAAYVLNEMHEADRPAALSRLWAATEDALVLIEPGTPEGFRQIKAARDYLLDRGASLLAPCPHEKSCPLPPDDWCHFSCRVARQPLHRQLKGGDAPYEDEKFCYLAFGRAKGARVSSRILRHPQIESGKITLQLCTPSGLLPCRCGSGTAHCLKPPGKQTAAMPFLIRREPLRTDLFIPPASADRHNS